MVSIDRFKQGAAAFIEEELVSKLPGWKKWVFGSAAAIFLQKADTFIEHPIVTSMGLVKDGMVDIDTVYREMKKRATEPISIDIPGLGGITMSSNDLDLLYRKITEG